MYVLVQAQMTNADIWTAVRERSPQVYGVQRCSPSLALLHWPDDFDVSTLAVDDWVLRVEGRRCHLSFTLPKCAAGSEMDTDEWYPAGIQAVPSISKQEPQQPSSKASQVGPMISSKLSQVASRSVDTQLLGSSTKSPRAWRFDLPSTKIKNVSPGKVAGQASDVSPMKTGSNASQVGSTKFERREEALALARERLRSRGDRSQDPPLPALVGQADEAEQQISLLHVEEQLSRAGLQQEC